MNQSHPIIKTLAFFKIFNQPLTLLELWERLFVAETIKWEDFKKNLDEFLVKGAVVEDRGFFFLAGSNDLVEKRIERILWENPKMEIAQHAAKLLRSIPFIKLVSVCNTLSFGVSKKASDIDFFIVVQSGRLWLVRSLAVFILFIFGLYRRGGTVEDKICLSFFIDEKKMDLQSLSLVDNTEGLPDIYLIYWITHLIPLINREQTLEKFWSANVWLKKSLANWDWHFKEEDYREVPESKFFNWKRKFWENILAGTVGDMGEKICKSFQLLKMRENKKTRRFDNTSAVVVSDEILKFHEEDRRELFRQTWKDFLNF